VTTVENVLAELEIQADEDMNTGSGARDVPTNDSGTTSFD